MSRKIKLQDTGEFSTSDVAYKAPNKKYYSSEEAYLKMKTNAEYRQKCIDKMFDLLGYKNNMVIPTFFYKKLKEFEGIGYDVLLDTMNGKENDIYWAIKNKIFAGETAKVMYITAILNNNIMDYYKRKIAREKEEKRLNDINSNVFIVDDMNFERKKETKNIKRFLEDDN